jgi:hypothetical protein
MMAAHHSSKVADLLEQSFTFLGDVSREEETPEGVQGEQSWNTFDKGVFD